MTFCEVETPTSILRKSALPLLLLRSKSVSVAGAFIGLAVATLISACAGGSPSMVGRPSASPVIVAMTPTAGQTNAYRVIGTNFATGLIAQVSQNGDLIESLSGSHQLSNLTATSFGMKTNSLPPGTYSLQVVNPDQERSVFFPFTVNAN